MFVFGNIMKVKGKNRSHIVSYGHGEQTQMDGRMEIYRNENESQN